MVKKKYSEEQKNIAIELLREGRTPREAATMSGVSESTVGGLVTLHGLQKRTKISSSIRLQICDLRKTGRSLKEISAITGVKIGTIGVIVTQAGLKQRADITSDQKKAAGELRRTTSLTLQQIAIQTGINPNSMESLVNEHGWRKSAIVTEDQKKRACELRTNNPNLFIREIAKLVGLKDTTTSGILIEAGLGFSDEQMEARYTQERKEREKRLHVLALEKGGAYVGGYTTNQELCDWTCQTGHAFSMRPANVTQDQWCPQCIFADGMSRPHKEIETFLREMCPDLPYLINDRKVIGPKELDIWIPSKKVAIEYCGLHYHGELKTGSRAKKRHVAKNELCEAQGIRLITIFADEWEYRRPQVEGYLRAILGAKGEKLPARKLIVTKGDKKEVKKFCQDFHIQGAGAGESFCLRDNDGRLIAAAVFSLKSRKGNVWTLDRYCVRPNCNVSGGCGRLLKAFCDYYQPRKIVSFSDKRWSQGRLYEALGFYLAKTIPVDYSYFKKGTLGPRIHKFNCRRKKLISMGADPGLTEWPMAKSVGFDRIWDCGKDRWELDFTATPKLSELITNVLTPDLDSGT